MLLDNEAGEITLEELNQFLTHFLKIQVDCLRVRLEKQKYERSMEIQKALGEMTAQ